ncbi:hypothetical protein EMMF5_005539 [Cystobasidiomycetes sp. EMM_F5]
MSATPSLFVAGADRLEGSSRFDVVNPLTGKTVWTCPSASLQDCNDAVDGLAAFQPQWEKVPASAKRAIFLRAADLVTEKRYADRIRNCMSSETAAAPGWIHVNIIASANLLREAASQASAIKGEVHRSEKPDVDMYIVQRRAAGVVFSMAPWNSPPNLALRGIAIPLICGNTVILKASEYSPASQRLIVDLLLEAGLPKEAIAFLTFSRKDAPELAKHIIGRREVARVTFTGSDVVGRIIASECGRNLKQCVLELGGKAPYIISKQAEDNLEAAAWGCVFSAMMHSGQICMSAERVLVQREVYERFSKLVADRVSKLQAGDPSATAALGPLFTQQAASNVAKQIADAVKDGAKVLTGAASGAPEGDYKTVIQPMVLGDVTTSMSIWPRETFGPVIALTPFDTMEEAIRLANDSEYSLIASLWTSNLHEAMKFAPQIKAGSVQVNGATIHVEPTFGNAGLGGASGYNRFNVDSFTDLRAIAFHGHNGKFPAFAV